jgi:hypothetical protein
MRRTCQNLGCVRPDHLEWELGLMTEQMLRSQSEGYVSMSVVRRRPESLDDDVPGDEAIAV